MFNNIRRVLGNRPLRNIGQKTYRVLDGLFGPERTVVNAETGVEEVTQGFFRSRTNTTAFSVAVVTILHTAGFDLLNDEELNNLIFAVTEIAGLALVTLFRHLAKVRTRI